MLRLFQKIFIYTIRISKRKLKGFLLTEAILSLFVLTVGLVSVVALISSSLKDSFNSRDTIIAVELAQEGAELVRNVRDNGFLNSSSNPFYKFDPTSKHCRIDYTVNVSANLNCSSGLQADSAYVLKYSGGFYQYGGGTTTKFSRYVYVDYNGSDTAKVRSFVYWGATPNFGGGGNTSVCTVFQKCVFTEITLTNWRG